MNIRAAVPDRVSLRYFDTDEIRVEAGSDGKPPKIVGYASVFNQPSKPFKTSAGNFIEKISPGAFANSLSSTDDIVALRDHDPKQILARRSANTLTLREDAKGLAFELTPPDTTAGRDLMADIQCGNIRGVSFGFDDPKATFAREDGQYVRTISSLTLKEISPTGFPAYPGTQINLRSEEVSQLKQLKRDDVDDETFGDYSILPDICDAALMQCRSTWDMLHNMTAMLNSFDPGTLTDSEVQAVRTFSEQMDQLSDKLDECSEACAVHMTTGEERSHIDRMQLIQKRAELGLPSEVRAGHMTHAPTTPMLNSAAVTHAETLISAGKINTGKWSFEEPDQARMLGATGSNWSDYAGWNLGEDQNAAPQTKDRFKYPMGKAGEVYPAALRAIRSRASQQGAKSIYDAAGKLLDAINKKLGKTAEAA